MGRKWLNVKFELNNPNKKIKEASANPKTREEKLYQYLSEKWSQEHVRPSKNVDIMFGNYYNKIEDTMKKLFAEFYYIDKAGAVYVTDSANVGYGWVFARNDSGNMCIEKTYDGYENAFGADVAGQIYDEYNIKIDEQFYW